MKQSPKIYATINKENGSSFMFQSPARTSKHSLRSTKSPRSPKKEFEYNCHKLTTFLKTLEMLALHWAVINPNDYRHRFKKIPGVKREMAALPKLARESYFYDAKTFVLSCKIPKLVVAGDKVMAPKSNFNHAACKLHLSLLNIVNLLSKISQAYKNYEKATTGFFNKLWNSIVDSNPVSDPEFHTELLKKLKDFDQNFRSLEEAYINNLKQVNWFI